MSNVYLNVRGFAVKSIRRVLKEAGVLEYDGIAYNDKRPRNRRIKFYAHRPTDWMNIETSIHTQLVEIFGDVLLSDGFEVCTTWRGNYDAYVVELKF